MCFSIARVIETTEGCSQGSAVPGGLMQGTSSSAHSRSVNHSRSAPFPIYRSRSRPGRRHEVMNPSQQWIHAKLTAITVGQSIPIAVPSRRGQPTNVGHVSSGVSAHDGQAAVQDLPRLPDLLEDVGGAISVINLRTGLLPPTLGPPVMSRLHEVATGSGEETNARSASRSSTPICSGGRCPPTHLQAHARIWRPVADRGSPGAR